MRAVLVVLGVLNAASGALALIAPDTFFDQVGHYGVENSHYVGDVGAFVLAFGVAVRRRLAPVVAGAGAGSGRSGTASTPSTTPSTSARRGARHAGCRHRCDRARRGCVAYLAGAARLGRLQRRQATEGRSAMKVFVAGASGVIGRPLVRAAGRGGARGHRDDRGRGTGGGDRGGRRRRPSSATRFDAEARGGGRRRRPARRS